MANDTTDRATCARALMELPALPAGDFFEIVLGLPKSTSEELIASGEAPAMFLLGRRRYIRQADALAWLDEMSVAAPYVKRANRKRRAA